jgi:hypothetical protein
VNQLISIELRHVTLPQGSAQLHSDWVVSMGSGLLMGEQFWVAPDGH